MSEQFAERVIRRIDQAVELYHRLIMLVAPAGAGKTAALKDVHDRTCAPLINVNLELSRRMLDLTKRQRILWVQRLMGEILSEAAADMVLFDNIEILFDNDLQQDPLRLLQGLSRNRLIVAAWSGEYLNRSLMYAEPKHREYRRYSGEDISGIMIVSPGG